MTGHRVDLIRDIKILLSITAAAADLKGKVAIRKHIKRKYFVMSLEKRSCNRGGKFKFPTMCNMQLAVMYFCKATSFFSVEEKGKICCRVLAPARLASCISWAEPSWEMAK